MLVITAFQRSGTTALGEQLGALPGFAYWGEVFHPEGYRGAEQAGRLRLRPAANWFRFQEEGLPAAHRSGPQSPDARLEAWRLYSRHLERLGEGRRPVIDVKYSSWRNLDAAWAPLAEPPLLLQAMKAGGAGFIHLVRENVLAQALSEVFAHESNLWHRRAGRAEAPADFRCEADIEGLLARMRESRVGTAALREWLTLTPHVELVYELTFDSAGDLTDGAREALAALGVTAPPGAGAPVLGRMGQDPRRWLSNRAEVIQALTDTEFEALIGSTLRG
mgnify:FL=1